MILDINSGYGHRVDAFTNKGIPIIGLESRPNIIKKAQESYPKGNFKSGDALNTLFFQPDSLTLT